MESVPRRAIRRLDPDTASRIAAGEVIERPLSALKELLENALDAGATRIEVRVERALDYAFQIADDGLGIAAADLELALERHATSKISDLDDLDRLDTLGFRGEALPSIAAVCRLRIASRPADAAEAAWLEVEGGHVAARGHVARARGTTVEVRDLYFNTPARRKFLRSSTGELRAALRLMESYGLAFPEVALRLVVDERERLDWPGAGTGAEGRRARAGAMWGARHAAQRLEIEGERDGWRLFGLLGLPEHARATREGQVLILNRRWIQNALVGQALRQAYGNLLPQGRFPSAALWIEAPADQLDVNVHPTKREVRFADDDRVFSLVAGTAAARLAHLHPPFTVVYGHAAETPWADQVAEPAPPQPDLGLEISPPRPGGGGGDVARAPGAAPDPHWALAAPGSEAVSAIRAAVAEPELFQLHRTYIMAPVRGGLIVVDQHAAHERILYEEARARLEGHRGTSQQLLFPALVDLSRDQFDLLLELGPWLAQLGWDLSPLGPPTVVIQGIPPGPASDQPGRLLQDVLDGVSEETPRGPQDDIAERVARSYACHAAVRAGDPLTLDEMRSLVDRLFATTRPHGDPHGRPTYVRITLDDLHRRFGRT